MLAEIAFLFRRIPLELKLHAVNVRRYGWGLNPFSRRTSDSTVPDISPTRHLYPRPERHRPPPRVPIFRSRPPVSALGSSPRRGCGQAHRSATPPQHDSAPNHRPESQHPTTGMMHAQALDGKQDIAGSVDGVDVTRRRPGPACGRRGRWPRVDTETLRRQGCGGRAVNATKGISCMAGSQHLFSPPSRCASKRRFSGTESRRLRASPGRCPPCLRGAAPPPSRQGYRCLWRGTRKTV